MGSQSKLNDDFNWKCKKKILNYYSEIQNGRHQRISCMIIHPTPSCFRCLLQNAWNYDAAAQVFADLKVRRPMLFQFGPAPWFGAYYWRDRQSYTCFLRSIQWCHAIEFFRYFLLLIYTISHTQIKRSWYDNILRRSTLEWCDAITLKPIFDSDDYTCFSVGYLNNICLLCCMYRKFCISSRTPN